MTVQALARPVSMHSLSPNGVKLVGALRFWALAMRMRWCPVRAVTDRLGSARAAAQFRLIVEEIGAAWPDPFWVSPPCTPRLSHDEMTIAQMLDYAARGDRPGFDRLLFDLLPAAERERVFLSFTVFYRVLDG